MSAPLEEDPTLHVETLPESTNEFSAMLKRLRTGDSGIIPVVLGLIALVLYFYFRNHVFLHPENLTNLFIQATVFILLGMAEIWLLLLGDIDLSLGYVLGIGGAVATITTSIAWNWPWYLGFAAALALTSLIALVSGLLTVYLKLPSFIVTLAGYIGYEGVLIYMVDKENSGGTVPVQNHFLYNLVFGNFTPLWTWLFFVILIVVAAALMLGAYRRRRSSGLVTQSIYFTVAKIVGLVVVGIALSLIFNADRSTFAVVKGMPFAIPIDIAMLLGGSFVLSRTKTGRYIYAIGGSSEATRRAGVSVNRYRLLAFVFAGFTAGVGGLLYTSNLGGMSDAMPGGIYVLYGIAAAVIGGTSLFGGRGKMIHAVIGGLIIATIYNGMALISISTAVQYIVIAIVLLAAVTVDSIARRGTTNQG
ncbi:MAG: sugar ABC transporter permease [Acidimicrobiales bacterium]